MITDPHRLRTLRLICFGFAASVAVYAFLSWLLLEVMGIEGPAGLPKEVPVTLTALAMVLILLSSRLRGTLLRRAFPRTTGLTASDEAIVAAYRQATLVAFALLEGAGALGLTVALVSGEPFYGLALCGAALLAMVTRWPNEGEVGRILRGRLVL
jgi:hypothetical protein